MNRNTTIIRFGNRVSAEYPQGAGTLEAYVNTKTEEEATQIEVAARNGLGALRAKTRDMGYFLQEEYSREFR